MTYDELLSTEEWQLKRQEIIVRDKCQCTNCSNKLLIDSLEKGLFQKKKSEKNFLFLTPFDGQISTYTFISEDVMKALPYKGGALFKRIEPNDALSSSILYGYRLLTDKEDYQYHGRFLKLLRYYNNWFKHMYEHLTLVEREELEEQIKKEADIFSKTGGQGYTEFPVTSQNEYSVLRGLHVHHTFYIRGNKPWQYDNKALVTLCELCHESVHAEQVIPVYKRNGERLGNFKPCTRCGGLGYLHCYSHVQGGVCFRCYGAGYDELIDI